MKKLLALISLIMIISCFVTTQNLAYAQDLNGYKKISVSSYFSLSVKDDGTVWVWGENRFGQLGDGTKQNRSKPVQVVGLTDIVSVEAGYCNSLAIKKDGTVWSWGGNNVGQLGDGTIEEKLTPVQVNGLTDIIELSVCSDFQVALKKDGTVWAWGDNYHNILGDNIDYSTLPIQLKEFKDIIDISASGFNLMALKKDGTVWAVGNNSMYQLGVDNWDFFTETPYQIKGLNDIISITAGGSTTVVLKNDGTVWALGNNMNGQLAGYSDEFYTYNIVQIKVLSDVVKISSDDSHIIALKKDGTVWQWGTAFLDFLDNIDSVEFENRMTLQQVKGLTDIVSVSAVYHHSMALQSDGSIWSWGIGKQGELGNDTVINSNTPVKTLINLGVAASQSIIPSYTWAKPMSSNVMINGKKVEFEAYNIDGYTYFKLRDLAMALNGSKKQIDVTWDQNKNAINLITNKLYTSVGGELIKSGNLSDLSAKPTTSSIYLDGSLVLFTAYNVNNNNYFKLRDVGKSIDFGVAWDGTTNTISLDTSTSYVE